MEYGIEKAANRAIQFAYIDAHNSYSKCEKYANNQALSWPCWNLVRSLAQQQLIRNLNSNISLFFAFISERIVQMKTLLCKTVQKIQSI